MTIVRMYIISFLDGVLSALIHTLCCIFCDYGIWKFSWFLFMKLAHFKSEKPSVVRLPNLLLCLVWTPVFVFDALTCYYV
jgi:hypothetical protein